MRSEIKGGRSGYRGPIPRCIEPILAIGGANMQPTHKERSQPKSSEPKKQRREAAVSTASDPDAIRTLVLTGLPADLTKAVLWKKIRKVHDGVDLKYPVEGEDNTGRSRLDRVTQAEGLMR